ncbi:MAG: hypothetical protein M3O35_17415 [Acidobacteriota bacterium]|nr:hypothetical protein [Acidobacteriota bacterium]
MATVPPAAPVQPSTKGKPLFWILGGCAVIIFLGAIAMVGGMMYLKSKGPAYLITKVITASNPNLDVVNVDSGTNKVTVRDKSTGKTYTVNFEDAKKGKLVLQEDGKDAVTVTASGDGDKGTVEFKSAEGSVKIGGDTKIPAWIPEYPGSQPQGTFSAQSAEGTGGTYAFKTKDAAEKVSKFYEDSFKSGGLEVNTNMTSENGKTTGGVVTAHDKSDDHTAAIVIGSDGTDTTVAVTFKFKK